MPGCLLEFLSMCCVNGLSGQTQSPQNALTLQNDQQPTAKQMVLASDCGGKTHGWTEREAGATQEP